MKAGDRVKYIGSKSGNGYPFKGEVGTAVEVFDSGKIVRVKLKDNSEIQLPVTEFRTSPLYVTVGVLSLASIVALIATWKIFRR
jgi:hypothetical protein